MCPSKQGTDVMFGAVFLQKCYLQQMCVCVCAGLFPINYTYHRFPSPQQVIECS